MARRGGGDVGRGGRGGAGRGAGGDRGAGGVGGGGGGEDDPSRRGPETLTERELAYERARANASSAPRATIRPRLDRTARVRTARTDPRGAAAAETGARRDGGNETERRASPAIERRTSPIRISIAARRDSSHRAGAGTRRVPPIGGVSAARVGRTGRVTRRAGRGTRRAGAATSTTRGTRTAAEEATAAMRSVGSAMAERRVPPSVSWTRMRSPRWVAGGERTRGCANRDRAEPSAR